MENIFIYLLLAFIFYFTSRISVLLWFTVLSPTSKSVFATAFMEIYIAFWKRLIWMVRYSTLVLSVFRIRCMETSPSVFTLFVESTNRVWSPHYIFIFMICKRAYLFVFSSFFYIQCRMSFVNVFVFFSNVNKIFVLP